MWIVIGIGIVIAVVVAVAKAGGGGPKMLPPFNDQDHHAYNVLRHKPKDQLTAEERHQLDEMWRKVD